MEDSVHMDTEEEDSVNNRNFWDYGGRRYNSTSTSSSSYRSTGPLEIDMDLLPPKPKPTPVRVASPISSAASSPCLSNGNRRLSMIFSNLTNMLNESNWDYSDADIIIHGTAVGVNRLVLASSSSIFREFFKNHTPRSKAKDRPSYYIWEILLRYPSHYVEYEAFVLLLGYLHTGELKPYPDDVSKCIDGTCSHDACRPAIDFQLQLLHGSLAFQIEELVSFLETSLLNVVEKALIEDVRHILWRSSGYKLNLLEDQCIKKLAQSDIYHLWRLPKQLRDKVRLFRNKCKQDADRIVTTVYPDEQRIIQIHNSLLEENIKLLYVLLNDSATTLDEIYGLHLAVSCRSDVFVSEILDKGIANVNRRDSSGYTPLHVAAIRGNSKILKSLLSKGACALDCTFDGHTALSICRRMISTKDYDAYKQLDMEFWEDLLVCVDILEKEL